MKPVMQTTFYSDTPEGKTRGNCYVACLASILELPIHGVPDFPRLSYGRSNWEVDRDMWLHLLGYQIEIEHKAPVGKRYTYDDIPWRLTAPDEEGWIHADGERLLKPVGPEYFIVSGPSPNHEGIFHACVWHNGKVVHDPNPNRKGEMTQFTEWERIEKVRRWDPTK